MRSEMQLSGVSLTDCPHLNGQKDVADKMMIGTHGYDYPQCCVLTLFLVDMLAFAMDNPPPATLIIITGDRDFTYAISTLALRGYNVVVVAPSNVHAQLVQRASEVLDIERVLKRNRSGDSGHTGERGSFSGDSSSSRRPSFKSDDQAAASRPIFQHGRVKSTPHLRLTPLSSPMPSKSSGHGLAGTANSAQNALCLSVDEATSSQHSHTSSSSNVGS